MKKIILVILALCSASAFGQGQSTLLDKYRQQALDYNHDLKVAQKSIKESIELEKMALSDRNPKLSGGANFQYTGNPMKLGLDLPSLGAPLSFQGENMSYGASLSILQPVYTGGRILSSIRMASHGQSLAYASADVVRSAVCFQTDVQYWTTVAKGEMVRIATDFRNSISMLVKKIEERVEVGLRNPDDLLMAEVQLNEAEYQLQQALSSFETGRMAFNSLIGIPLDEKTGLDSVVLTVSVPDSLFAIGADNRAEIRMANEQIKITKSAMKLSDSKYLPQFYVGAEGSYSSPGYNFNADLNPNYAIYAKLSVPIFEWGKRQSEKRASSQKVGIATDNLNKVEDKVNLEVHTARVALRQAMDRVALSESSLSKARQNEQKALERYEEGEISIVEVIQAQSYRQNSEINYTTSKASAQGYYSELVKAINGYTF